MPGRTALVLRAYLFTDLAAFVEKPNHRIPSSIDADNDAIGTLFVFNPQRRGFVGRPAQIDPVRVTGMSREEFLPFRSLLILGQFVDLQAGIQCLLNRVISTFADLDRGKLILVLAAGINCKI
jgi:hypothetical protein